MRPLAPTVPPIVPSTLALLLAAAAPAALPAQEVSPCDPVPSAAALIEPWEETTVALAEGAVRLALLEGEEGTRRLLVLTLPPPEPAPAPEPDSDAAPETPAETPAEPPAEAAGEAPEATGDAAPAEAPAGETVESDPTAPPPERTCRIVSEGGLGFADLDLAGLSAEEDAAAGTLVVRLPALHFIPESSELAQETLVLTLGVADDSLAASVTE